MLALLIAVPVAAEDLRDLCPDRPGFGTPACIVDKGHVIVEAGLGEWEHDRTPDAVSDILTGGDLLARVGVTDRLEAFAGWTAYSRERLRDRASGSVSHRHGTGDVSFGIKQSLLDPSGEGTSVAVQMSATAPTGTNGFGEAGWTQGVIVPVQFDLGGDTGLALSPEIERVPDTRHGGHHARWSNAVGLSRAFGKVTAEAEVFVSRDNDPGDRTTQAFADLNLAWQPADDLQLDAEVDAGLNHDTPDLRIAIGLARRF